MSKPLRLVFLKAKRVVSGLCTVSLVMCIFPPGVPADYSDDDEIKLLISRAPLTEAIRKNEGESLIVVWCWLAALASSGRTKEAFGSDPRVRKKLGEDEFLGAISTGLSMAGKTDEALSVARSIPRDSQYSSPSSAIEILLRAERYADAIAESKTISDVDERTEHLCTIAMVLAKRGRTDQALKLAQDGGEEFDHALGEVAKKFAEEGKGGESLGVAQRISYPNTRFEVLESCAAALANLGKTTDAISSVNAITDSQIRSSAIQGVIEELSKTDRSAEALGLLSRMEDPYLKSLALAAAAAAVDKTGRSDKFRALMDQARSALKDVKEPSTRNKALSLISTYLAKGGLIDIARSTAQECQDEDQRYFAFEEVATAMLKAGRYEEAFALARSIPDGFDQRDKSLARVVEAVNLSADAAGFRQTVNDRSSYQPGDYPALVEGLAAAGRNEEAIVVASAIPGDQGERDFAFTLISASLARSGSYKQARVAADNVFWPLSRLQAYAGILTAFAASRNPQLKVCDRTEKIDMVTVLLNPCVVLQCQRL